MAAAARSGRTDDPARLLVFVRAEIVDRDIATLQRPHEDLFNVCAKRSAVDRWFRSGRGDAVMAQRGEECQCFLMPMRHLVDELQPRRDQPRKGVMLVLVRVSSMKTIEAALCGFEPTPSAHGGALACTPFKVWS